MRHEWLKYSPSEARRALLLTSWDCEINAVYYDTRNVSFSREFVIAAGDAINFFLAISIESSKYDTSISINSFLLKKKFTKGKEFFFIR